MDSDALNLSIIPNSDRWAQAEGVRAGLLRIPRGTLRGLVAVAREVYPALLRIIEDGLAMSLKTAESHIRFGLAASGHRDGFSVGDECFSKAATVTEAIQSNCNGLQQASNNEPDLPMR